MTETTPTQAPEFSPTAAQRYLDENKDAMQAAIAQREQALRDDAEAMSVADLRAAVEQHNAEAPTYTRVKAPAKSAPKAEWVAAYVSQRLKDSAEKEALRDAESPVFNEDYAERQMRALIEQRDRALAELREKLTDEDPARAAYQALYYLEWHADDFQEAMIAAQVAQQYLDARARGIEPAALAKEVVRQGNDKVHSTVSMPGNLRIDSHGVHAMAEANGHRKAMNAVSYLLPREASEYLGRML